MKRKKKSISSAPSSSSSSDSDYQQEDFTPSPAKSPNPPPAKKKLALPKAPRSARRNRRAEVAVDVFDSEDDGIPCIREQGFDVLVEAAAFHQHHNSDGGPQQAHPPPLHAPSSPANAATKDLYYHPKIL